ncbi:GD15552 [Drosophila simulans]|uniref:GD15552 n=1 Tax=Drosophila simulans TaxID=7240 RepID=B4R2V9_DROSI|nr:GD15552 [Drosophila simulans]
MTAINRWSLSAADPPLQFGLRHRLFVLHRYPSVIGSPTGGKDFLVTEDPEQPSVASTMNPPTYNPSGQSYSEEIQRNDEEIQDTKHIRTCERDESKLDAQLQRTTQTTHIPDGKSKVHIVHITNYLSVISSSHSTLHLDGNSSKFPAHMVGNCTSRHTRRICRRKHHTLVNGNYFDTASLDIRDRPSVSRAGSTIGHNQTLAREGRHVGSEPTAENNFTHHTLKNIPAAGS